MKLWIVGRVLRFEPFIEWDYQGVYDTEEKAIAACSDVSYFVGPTELNNPIPHETTAWPNAYYPLEPVV